MSNEEKKRREQYKLQRKKWILIQIIIMAVVTLFTVITGYVYHLRSQTFYINYTETSNIDYRVRYDQNSFYEEEWQDKGQDYVGGLIEDIEIQFNYKLDTEASNVKYEYSYDITAKMDVREKGSTKELLPEERSLLENGAVLGQIHDSNSPLRINQTILVNYDIFNDYVRGYVNNFKLDNLLTNLVIKMTININSTCEEYDSNSNSTYEMSLVIPLIDQVVSISESASVPPSEGKLLACESNLEKLAYKVLSFIGFSADLALAVVLVGYILLTRNTDVNYENKIRKIVNNYKSFIQKIKNGFNMEGYQILEVDTFEELLEIRDTIQEPVLMSENEDKTCTTFIVPTNKNILYIYEVKVDDYDEIYNQNNNEDLKEEN